MILKESDVRQAVAVALTASMAVPQASWCRGFVEESILADLTAAQEASTSTATDAANNSTSTGPAPELANPDAGSVLELSPDVLDLVEQYQQATADAHPSSSESAPARQPGKASSTRGSKKSRAATGTAAIVQGSTSSSPAEVQAVTEKLQAMFGQLLQDNYLQVEDADVAVFSLKLLQELSHLVEAAVSAQQEDVEGLCQLCEREMPLTKHHLIPRDVHKDFKKRGFGFTELQSGLMVCRPCHSAIHRAVPDNKELGLHFRTLEALRQHKEIAGFSLWARRQRVTSKADVGSAHFKYRR